MKQAEPPLRLKIIFLAVILLLAAGCYAPEADITASMPEVVARAYQPTVEATEAADRERERAQREFATPSAAPETAGAESATDAHSATTASISATMALAPVLTATIEFSPTNQPETLGISYWGLPLESYRFGDGPSELVFVGGIHGGYEWNTILLAYDLVDYLSDHPDVIPDVLTVYVIPNANPDGLFAVSGARGRFSPEELYVNTIPGRFNGRGVDLNRNWDCNWGPTGVWGTTTVSGGAAPFSETETWALREFFLELKPKAVIFYHSAAEGVYATGCGGLYVPSRELADVYREAAGYPVHDGFFHYPISGAAGDWLTTQGINSITVELLTHEDIEWERNLDAILAIIDYYTPKPAKGLIP